MSEVVTELPAATVRRAWKHWSVSPPEGGPHIAVADRDAGIQLCVDRGWQPVNEAGEQLKCWNPRYLAYCRAQGTPDPEAMDAIDRKRWPGGCMAGFILWMSSQWSDWHRETGVGRIVGDAEHRAFDAWLQAKYPPV